jgi:Xaa-Pro dipeptidase
VYLPIPHYAKYINASKLEDFYRVGGVRIEDDILVVANGFENLTAAPKGSDMLAIING